MAVKITKQPGSQLTFRVSISSTNIVAVQCSLSVALGQVGPLDTWISEPGCIAETDPYVGFVLMPGTNTYSISFYIPDTATVSIYDVWAVLRDFATGKQLASLKVLDEVQIISPSYSIVSISYA